MKEIAKTYNPTEVEDKWTQYWEDHKLFQSVPDGRPPYTIVIPPPNVTGVLHMGHMLNNTIQDILVRRKRMTGFNALWVPGTDHASIATEAKVVNLLREKGIRKSEIGRELFLKEAFAWKEKYGGVILQQLRKMGASCDWSRTRFTMEESLSNAVIHVFIDLYRKGYIYRGLRMINWDPQGKTALSDEEVIYKESQSKLYHVRYPLVDNPSEGIVIATTRPETILADTAVAVHPEDERYKHLVGKKVRLPFINREVVIIADEYVDPAFGTGCLKITPAHDPNDYELGKKYNLEIIDILNEDGSMASNAQRYIGLDRFEARRKIVEDLTQEGYIVKIEEIANKIGRSERTDAVVEPRLSLQWFVNMQEISKPALRAVMDADTMPDADHIVNLIPKRFVNTYKHWLENVRDWCISRQLWWGHRIPAYYFNLENNPEKQFVVAYSQDEAFDIAKKQGFKGTIEQLQQDEDVLDTWFSSWLWPLSVFDGITNPENPDFKYYYPTNDLVTAPEILFFWVARMIIAGYEYSGKRPFENVYLTGIVRDKQGRKMSKSLGNSPDPLDLIAKYSADGMRMGMLLCSPAGNDLPFDESLCEQGRNFANKVWNAFRLIKSLEAKIENREPNSVEIHAIQWMQARICTTHQQLEGLYNQFRLSEALMTIYKLIWDDYCAWFLELIKPAYNNDTGDSQTLASQTYNDAIVCTEQLLQLLHPIMPFLTEEIWHNIRDREPKDCITISQIKINSNSTTTETTLENQMEDIRSIVTAVRGFRSQKGLSPKETLELNLKSPKSSELAPFYPIILKLANISQVQNVSEKVENTNLVVVNQFELYIPLLQAINLEEETEKIKQEITYLEGFLESVMKKLNNEKFVTNAKPEVLEKEQQKRNDTENKLNALRESLLSLK